MDADEINAFLKKWVMADAANDSLALETLSNERHQSIYEHEVREIVFGYYLIIVGSAGLLANALTFFISILEFFRKNASVLLILILNFAAIDCMKTSCSIFFGVEKLTGAYRTRNGAMSTQSSAKMISSLGTICSCFILILISVNEYLYIRLPLHYKQHVTMLRACIVILITWVISILLTILPRMLTKSSTLMIGLNSTSLTDGDMQRGASNNTLEIFEIGLMSVLIMLLLVVMAVYFKLYTTIQLSERKQGLRRMKSARQSTSHSLRSNRSKSFRSRRARPHEDPECSFSSEKDRSNWNPLLINLTRQYSKEHRGSVDPDYNRLSVNYTPSLGARRQNNTDSTEYIATPIGADTPVTNGFEMACYSLNGSLTSSPAIHRKQGSIRDKNLVSEPRLELSQKSLVKRDSIPSPTVGRLRKLSNTVRHSLSGMSRSRSIEQKQANDLNMNKRRRKCIAVIMTVCALHMIYLTTCFCLTLARLVNRLGTMQNGQLVEKVLTAYLLNGIFVLHALLNPIALLRIRSFRLAAIHFCRTLKSPWTSAVRKNSGGATSRKLSDFRNMYNHNNL